MDDDQQFCLRWNNHQSTLISVFDTLLENETLVDCTLAAEGKFLKAHKVVLSACSPYFATLLQEQYDKHPIFILKDVKYQELRAMMDYMYRGEVNISQDQLTALLKAAESLQIKGLSDNRSGGGGPAAAAAQQQQQAPKPDTHHRVKLSGQYTLEQTKRARITTGGPVMDAGDVSGSREGSSSPSRRRRKVRRRSMENDVHDNSNSSVQQAVVASNQPILQQTSLVASALVSTQLASGSGAVASSTCGGGSNSSGTSASQLSNQPLNSSSSSNVTKKTESARLTSTAAAAQGAQQQQQQTTSDAINTDNVQQQQQQQQKDQGAQGDADEMGVSSGGVVAVHTGVVKQLSTLEKSNHKLKIKDSTTSITQAEMVIEPKAEYDDDVHDENVEDLTLDEEEITMEELDQAAGTSQGGEGSSQAYATWQHDRSQDELGLMAAQDAQQRDPQDLSITRIAGLTWNEWNARLAMPLVTLREGVQPLVFPTDLSVDKQLSIASMKVAASADDIDRKSPTDFTSPKIEPGNTSTPRSMSEKQHKIYPGGGKLKHLSEEEATSLMLKAVAEKQARAAAAAAKNSTDLSLSEDNGNGSASGEYPITLTGSVSLADVGPAGLCHINILNSISAMNNLISGSTTGTGGGTGANLSVTLSPAAVGNSSNHSSIVGADNGAGHPCPVCGRVYKLKSSLRNHQKWECGKEPQFQCPFCVYRAKQKMHIGRHMERMHKEKFQMEDDKSFISGIIGASHGSGSAIGPGGSSMDTETGVGSGSAAAAVAAVAAAAALANASELHTHFS